MLKQDSLPQRLRTASILLETHPAEARKLLEQSAIGAASSGPSSTVQLRLAAFEKELVDVMPQVYSLLDDRRPAARQGTISMLIALSPEKSIPVLTKLTAQLKDPDVTNKLLAAIALLRTKPKDKSDIARALGEVMSFPNRPIPLDVDQALQPLRIMGPEGKSAALSLLTAFKGKERPDVKGKILLTLAAMKSLARLGSPEAEELALEAWHRPDPEQQWARMMALDVLEMIGSPQLEALLMDAEKDERKYLAEFAKGIRETRSAV